MTLAKLKSWKMVFWVTRCFSYFGASICLLCIFFTIWKAAHSSRWLNFDISPSSVPCLPFSFPGRTHTEKPSQTLSPLHSWKISAAQIAGTNLKGKKKLKFKKHPTFILEWESQNERDYPPASTEDIWGGVKIIHSWICSFQALALILEVNRILTTTGSSPK